MRQSDGVVVSGVPRTVEKNHRAPASRHYNRLQRCGVGIEFSGIATQEFRSFCRVVAKPTPQSVTGSDVLEPGIEFEILLFDTPGPEAVH